MAYGTARMTGVSLSLRTAQHLHTDAESGERELYDMRTDPFELTSLHRSADPGLMATLSARAAALFRCRGASCYPTRFTQRKPR